MLKKIKKSDVINNIVSNTPFLEDYLSEGLVNHTALSKKIVSYLEKLKIKASEASILMSLKRFNYPFEHKRNDFSFYMSDIGEITVTPNLRYCRLEKSHFLDDFKMMLIKKTKDEIFKYLLFETHTSTTVIFDMKHSIEIDEIMKGINIVEKRENLSAVNLNFSSEEIRFPGLYYVLFKQLSWNNINVYELSSSGREITILIKNEDVKSVFDIIHKKKITVF